MFTITESKGFQMTFANGYRASVQFGNGNYCSNRYNKTATDRSAIKNTTCKNAEVGCFAPNGEAFRLEGQEDIWIGYVTPDDLVAILAQIASL